MLTYLITSLSAFNDPAVFEVLVLAFILDSDIILSGQNDYATASILKIRSDET